jgi:hypothetical protein
MVWCGVVWYGMVWCGVVWYGMVHVQNPFNSLRLKISSQLIST